MKKLILVIAALTIAAGAFAQTDSTKREMSPRDMNNLNVQTHPDGVMMQNGKMIVVQNGKLTNLDRDMTMSNGTKISSDGTYIKKDGTKVMMKEGQHLDMSGNLISMKTSEKNMDLVPDSTSTK